MIRILYLVMAVLLFSGSGLAQRDSGFVLIRSYGGDIVDATVDRLDNLYLISSTGQIRKYASNGDSTGIYNQVRNFGKLYSLDVSNPLRPLLFYKDFSTVVLLDRFLSQRATIDLRKYGILQPGAVGISYDNNIWVFDEWDNKLRKIDEQGTKLLETPDFRTIFEENLRPRRIIDDNGLVYLADSSKGVMVFDIYGAYKKRLPLKNWQSLSVKENYVIYLQPSAITVYNTQNFREMQKPIPGSLSPYLKALTTTNRLLTFTKEGLRVYQFGF